MNYDLTKQARMPRIGDHLTTPCKPANDTGVYCEKSHGQTTSDCTPASDSPSDTVA